MKKPIASVLIPVLALSILVVAHFIPPTTPFDKAPQLVVSLFIPLLAPPRASHPITTGTPPLGQRARHASHIST